MSIYEDPKAIHAWLDRLRGDRGTVENTWQEISDDALGSRDFNTQRSPGMTRTDKIYDATSLDAHQLLAGGMHGLFTNPATENLDLELDDPRLNDDFENAVWLEDARRKMSSVISSSGSSFQQNMAEYWLDVSGWGMGGISLMNIRGRPVFKAHPLSELFVEEGEEGKIDIVFRDATLTARQFATRFAQAPEMPLEIQKALENENPEARFSVVQVIGKSDDPFAGQSPFRKEWTTSFAFLGAQDMILEIGGFDEMPLMVGRWQVETGETYGRGPGHIALPEAKMLNEMAKTKLKALQKAADPPLLVQNESVLSGIRTNPGGVNIVEYQFGQGGNSDPIRPLQNNAQIQLTQEEIGSRQELVRRLFFANVLQLFDNPEMTAEQVIQLAQRMQQLMAPIMGRQEGEILEPIYNRLFNMMLRMGNFLPVPTGLRGQTIKVVYRSPIVRAQRSSDGQAVLQTWQSAALIAQAGGDPSALDALDADASVRFIHNSNAAPRSILRDAEAVEAMRQERAQQQEQAQQLDQLGQGAEIVKTLGNALGPQGAEAA
ncbi:MAG TPA: portal protein [Anaerolineae bacterium]|nr:portal protein [Anaerolineae bacterium]